MPMSTARGSCTSRFFFNSSKDGKVMLSGLRFHVKLFFLEFFLHLCIFCICLQFRHNEWQDGWQEFFQGVDWPRKLLNSSYRAGSILQANHHGAACRKCWVSKGSSFRSMT